MSRLSHVINQVGKTESALVEKIHRACEVLRCVTGDAYLGRYLGRKVDLSTTKSYTVPAGGALRGLTESPQAQLVYTELKKLIEALTPARVAGSLPSESGKPLTPTERTKSNARWQLLQAAEDMVLAGEDNPQKSRKLADIRVMKQQTERGWGKPAPQQHRLPGLS